MQNPENNLITIQTHKEITRLYKSFLELIEDIRHDHNAMLQKVESRCGKEASQELNYLDQSKYEQLRKKVLDSGNECARQMINFLDFYDFTINSQKLEAAASQRRIVKKFVTSTPLIVK